MHFTNSVDHSLAAPEAVHATLLLTTRIDLDSYIYTHMKAMDGAGGKPEYGTMKAFGIDFGEKDLVDVFATCVFCLIHAVDRAPTATEVLELSVIRLRLTRWGEAVKIFEKPSLGHYDPDPDELYTTRQVLVDIIRLFDTGNPDVNVIVTHLIDIDVEAQLLQESLGAIASERLLEDNNLLGSQYLGLGRWSEVQSKRASGFIRCLENLFGSQHLRELCASERLRINNEGAIKRLRAVANSLDPWMSDDIAGTYIFNQTINVGSGAQFCNTGAGNQFNNMAGGVKFIHFGGDPAS